jgi:Mrp family chromosome partitioning ATPase
MAITTRAAQQDLVPATSRAGGLLITDPSCPPAVREAYAQTFLNVRFALHGAAGNTLLVSAVDTTSDAAPLAANLAILAAREGERVVLVDTNAHAPSLDALFNLTAMPGFTTLVRQESVNPTASLQQVDMSNLYVLGVEQGKIVPGGLGRAPGLAEIVLRLKNICDRLILIGAPILSSVDSLDLCALVDGAVATMRHDKTHREDAARANELLTRARAPLLGVVLSRHGA